MARLEFQDDLLPSIVDRLIDPDPSNRFEAPVPRAQAFRNLKQSLKRDLENLLNTRRNFEEAPEWTKELRYSLYAFGIPDFTSFSLHSTQDQNRVLRMMETAISLFEPRLESVVVTMQPVTGVMRMLHFQIEAMLRVEPAPERILFDTTLELTSGQYIVEGDSGAR